MDPAYAWINSRYQWMLDLDDGNLDDLKTCDSSFSNHRSDPSTFPAKLTAPSECPKRPGSLPPPPRTVWSSVPHLAPFTATPT